MSKKDKLVARFVTIPADFTWDEFCRLLRIFGFEEVATGQTGGSRRRFVHKSGAEVKAHEPHPRKIVKRYVLRETYEILRKGGFL